MNLKTQPQIRVIDPESESFGEIYSVDKLDYSKQLADVERIWVYEDETFTEHETRCLEFNQFQELTPLSHDGTRIGVGDSIEANVPNEGDKIIDWYEAHDGVVWLVTNDITNITPKDITDHTPLTEMEKEEEDGDKGIGICPICREWRKDLDILMKTCGDCRAKKPEVKSGDDKPTIERVVTIDSLVGIEAFEPMLEFIQEELGYKAFVVEENKDRTIEVHDLEALADAGIINLDDNQN
jgi:hypothetical protein